MKTSLKNIIAEQVTYRNRVMVGIVISELLVLGVFNLWPVPQQDEVYQDVVFTDQNAMIDEVQITRQTSSPPPPPRPQVPVPVPNDRVIEEEMLTLQEIDVSEYSDSLQVHGLGRIGDSDQVTANPQLPPSVVRIVEPTVPEAARKADIKAEILVSFLVDQQGRVEEATIAQIRLYDDKSDDYRVVQSIGYGVPEATLEAALQWRFRPAKNNGKPVKAFTKHIFSYGF